MSPTTLVTFRVRAPAHTRGLQLYGSWDNFSVGYAMSKDLQKGSEYWSGCFNFTNIICDGKPAEVLKSRNGGLKMGGTYWYYYKIDDVTDFHNVCERATTTCPLLPGQLVNVLNVPYAFSGNRSRDASAGSTSSERRTMDPNDKFENPRPAPAKPEPMRLSTSPTTMEPRGLEDPFSLNETPNTNRFLRLPRKASVDSPAGPVAGAALAGGLRAAFKLRTARSKSPEVKQTTRVPDHRRAVSTERRAHSDEPSFIGDQRKPRARGLLLRSASDESIQTLSFEQHRRRRSPSTEARCPNNTDLKFKQVAPLALSHSNCSQMETVTESLSDEPIGYEQQPPQTISHKAQLDLEKRLPTLPNTPSSAYPASVTGNSPPRAIPLDVEQLDSRFSATTVDTEFHPLSMALNERSHFSAWTTTTADRSSIFMDSSVPLPDDRGRALALAHDYVGVDRGGEPFLPSLDSFSSISSSFSTTPSISYGELDLESESGDIPTESDANTAYTGRIPQYSLPQDSCVSQVTLKPILEEPSTDTGKESNLLAVTSLPESYNDDILHSESMQRLLEELSYLSDMIQH